MCHPDSRYNSTLGAKSNIYLVEIGDFDTLPDLTADIRG
jgi:hypothetical protein